MVTLWLGRKLLPNNRWFSLRVCVCSENSFHHCNLWLLLKADMVEMSELYREVNKRKLKEHKIYACKIRWVSSVYSDRDVRLYARMLRSHL